MKNIIIVTGGAGFVGTNLIELFIKKTKYKIISIDDYSSGKKINHIQSKRVKYIKSNTKHISKILHKLRKNINSIFHYLFSPTFRCIKDGPKIFYCCLSIISRFHVKCSKLSLY